MSFVPRKWQQNCLDRFLEKIKEGQNTFILEACMGAGKSALAAWISKVLLDEHGIDHVIVLVPWRSIQGDVEKGMLGAFGQLMGLDARDRFFTLKRRQARQPRPDMDATITLYQEVCNQEAIETLKMWKADGFTFALICDEIHHTNEIDSSWGDYVEEIQRLAAFSVFMSGTYFRGDRKPIRCVPLDPDGVPIKDYRFTYSMGVKENVVRAVTTRDFNANVLLYDKKTDRTYELTLKEIGNKELPEAKKQVLDPHGECIRHMIETAHEALLQTRTKFPDAGCLYVCRPGGGDNYTRDDSSAQAQEDRHVHLIAKQIESITGEQPTVVTHRDRDAIGKIGCFRRGTNPYLVAVNMISEGCDIPRLRAVAFCRYTTSEMLFRQIVGRALRLHQPEDGTAAQIYLPAFPLLLDFAERLYTEAQEGIRDRRCHACGEWPCECPCPDCGKHPCECTQSLFPTQEPMLLAIDATPMLDGGHVGADHVPERYVGYAIRITQENDAHRHANHTQLGHALKRFMEMQQQDSRPRPSQPSAPAAPTINPGAEREKFRRRINRHVKQLAVHVHDKDFAKAYYHEIQVPFRVKLSVILNTWSVDKLRQVADRLERRIVEVFRRG
jgi:superfamily II DNA or RNA helicase